MECVDVEGPRAGWIPPIPAPPTLILECARGYARQPVTSEGCRRPIARAGSTMNDARAALTTTLQEAKAVEPSAGASAPLCGQSAAGLWRVVTLAGMEKERENAAGSMACRGRVSRGAGQPGSHLRGRTPDIARGLQRGAASCGRCIYSLSAENTSRVIPEAIHDWH